MKNNFHRFSLLDESLIHFTISTTEIGENIAGVLKVLYSGLQGHWNDKKGFWKMEEGGW